MPLLAWQHCQHRHHCNIDIAHPETDDAQTNRFHAVATNLPNAVGLKGSRSPGVLRVVAMMVTDASSN
jgi:hypothetical protein